MIERLEYPRLVLNPPNPVIAIKERAYLDCGCQVFCGIRLDNREVATMVGSCSDEHDQIARHFNMLLAESTVDPTDELLVNVCERLLQEAQRYALGS